MWVLPFLHYHHAYPLTTFYQEWGAAVLGMGAMTLLMTQRFWRQPEIPRIILLPIGLMLLVMVQFALGKVAYLDQVLLITLYMLWAALLIMLGQRLREELGMPLLATVLAAFLLLGAELSALAGVLQHFHWHTPLDAVVTVKISAAVYGNLAQPNHFADYITLGLISLGLLRISWRLRAWQAVLLAAPLLLVLALSGSRSAWLYLLCMAGMAFLWQRREKSCLPLLHYSLLLLLGFALMNGLVQLPLFAAGTSTAQRLIEGGTGNSIRLYLWHEAWLIFTQFPLLGAGFGQFAWQHFQLGPLLHATNINGLYNNAHNFVMQIAAEMGLPGLLILFGTMAPWIRQARAAPRSIYHWWGFALLAVLAIHSLLEYPLWYAYFLGVAALALGMLDTTTYRLELRGIGRLSVATTLLLGLLSLSQMLQSYRGMEDLMAMRPASATDENYSRQMYDGLKTLHGQSLLRPYAELFMSGSIELDADHLADKRALNESVMHFVPISPVVYREAFLLALSGEQAAAQTQMERAIWSYPADFPPERDKLRALALKDPAHFSALLEFALKKNEERLHAIHTR
ncbi:MAG: Wzy polymerase domain-containing protein [Gallionellaceae bacterium]|nr:Wzy polymerase domain-containing protein [Gallionellaceae bacterium]